MTILNTGGTFNKRYNPINGLVEVPYDNLAVEMIMRNFSEPVNLAGVIYKDSLDMQISSCNQTIKSSLSFTEQIQWS